MPCYPACPDCECDEERVRPHLEDIDVRGTDAFDDPLGAKLAVFDEHAPAAVRYLIDWLRDNPEQVIAVARGRLITGHYVHGDRLMYEYEQGRLQKEVLEELADGVVYQHLHLSRS